MPNVGNTWKQAELSKLKNDYLDRLPGTTKTQFSHEWGKKYDRSMNSVKGQIDRLLGIGELQREIVRESPYPTYDQPLVTEGDAVVLPDVEFPFHNADFMNRVLDLCQRWDIRKAIFAGDVLHFDSLSGWEPNWVNADKGGITADAEKLLMDFAKGLPGKRQDELINLVMDIGEKKEQDGVSTELNVARRELGKVEKLFDSCDFLIGNHEGRLLRALSTTLDPEELLRLVDIKNPKWRIAPYYYSYLDTAQGRYIIEHPKNASKFSAGRLASKYQAHVLMAHSHQLNYTFDPSGRFYAIEMGCMVDESKLPYASQRHNISPTHSLGAVIIRDGFPHLLHPRVDWKSLVKL